MLARRRMTFVSLTFLLFLALTVAGYWALKRRNLQNGFLVAASYLFYGWWDYRFLGLLVASSLVDFAVGLALERTDSPRRRALLISISVVANLGLLGFFKYFNFFAHSAQAAASALGFELSPFTLNVTLPVGISFYTFQTLSYGIDVYRRELRATSSLIDYLAYVSFFPQLVAGPIERATNLLPQFQRSRHLDPLRVAEGCRLVLWGFFKKAAIADNLGRLVDTVYGNPGAHSGGAIAVATIAFAFQIYCDFSGYSDIAIGCARFFGFDLMRNFAYPYFSQDVAEFWRRWHISLSTWFRDYVFVPLGGSRRGPRRTAINIFITFVVSGLWHGAAWTFVIWGAINGLAVMIKPLLPQGPRRSPRETPGGTRLIPDPATLTRILGTFALICLTWVFFRASDVETAAAMLVRMFSFAGGTGIAAVLRDPRHLAGMALVVVLIVVEWTRRDSPDVLRCSRWPLLVRMAIYTIMLWATVLLLPPSQSPFIYFQF